MSMLGTFRTTSPTRQIVLVALAAAILAAVLFTAYALLLRKPYAVLYSNLRTGDAATIVAELDHKKVPYRLSDHGATISVPSEVLDNTRLDLANEELPVKGTVGFELFNKSDMGLTEFAQRINYQRALQGELARTIMTMDPIESARVHLMLAEPTIFRDDRRASKAAVTVLVRPGKAADPQTVQGIQRLVAAAVPDLAATDVVVLDQAGKPLTAAEATTTITGLASPQGQERQAIEQYYAGRIRASMPAGLSDGVRVDVTARTDSAANGEVGALDSWTPGARGFPLSVKIYFQTLPNPEIEDQVRRQAGAVIGLDEAKGDQVTLASDAGAGLAVTDAPAVTNGALPALASVASPAGPAPRPTPLWLAALVPLLVLLLALAAVLHLRRARPRRPTERQREEFASRLRVLLDEGDADAATIS